LSSRFLPKVTVVRQPKAETVDAALTLPRGCRAFTIRAAYVFRPERGSLSCALVDRCDYLIRIPARFSVNVAIAGAIVMDDRIASLGRFAPRPVRAGGPTERSAPHVFGDPTFRRRPERFRAVSGGDQ
jgi:hypothetical protein